MMEIRIRRLLKIPVLAVCVFWYGSSGAQDMEYLKMKVKHDGEFAVNLEMKESVNFSIDKNELKVSRHVYEKKMYLTDKVPSTLRSSVTHSSFHQLKDIEAQTLVPKGNGKYRTVKVDNYAKGSARSQGIFYDDLQAVSFFYEEVKEGAITEVDYTVDIAEPRLMGAAYLQSYYPTEYKEVTITFPKEVKITIKLLNTEDLDMDYTETDNGKTTTYKWVLKNVPKMEFESDAPDPRYYMPMIHIVLNEVTFPLGRKKYLGDEKDLHKWYRDLIVGYDDQGKNDANIRELVDSITQGLDSDREKVRAIYYWVQDNIKYIAFEDNLSGFIPRPPAKVCNRRFGDCKDMASIIREMCAQAGVDAYLTWIGTRDIPYRYADVPTASSDNHMIATWFDEQGNPVFLDATAKYFEFGVAPYHIQGKEALISISENEYKVIEVPFADKSYSQVIDSSWLRISGDELQGIGKHIQTGYNRNFTTYYLINRTDEERQSYLKVLLRKGNNKFSLRKHEIQNLEDVEEDLVMKYGYTIPGYVNTVNDEYYIDLNLIKEVGKKIKDDRKIPFEYDYKVSQQHVFILEIPEGYEVKYMPEDHSDSIDGFTVTIDYDLVEGRIVYKMDISMEYIIMEKSLFEDWNQLYTRLNRALSENIVLRKK